MHLATNRKRQRRQQQHQRSMPWPRVERSFFRHPFVARQVNFHSFSLTAMATVG